MIAKCDVVVVEVPCHANRIKLAIVCLESSAGHWFHPNPWRHFLCILWSPVSRRRLILQVGAELTCLTRL